VGLDFLNVEMHLLVHLLSEVKAGQKTMQTEMKAMLIANQDELVMINANNVKVEVT
jgi:hypothetical protein